MPINMGQKPPQNATSLGFDPNGHTHPHRLTESWILTSKVVDQPIELSSQLCCCTILAPPSNLERHLYFFSSNCSDIIFEQAPMTHVGLLLPLLEMNKSLTWSGLKVSSPRRNPAVNLFASDLRTLSTVWAAWHTPFNDSYLRLPRAIGCLHLLSHLPSEKDHYH